MYSKYFLVASALILTSACGPEAAIAPSSTRALPRAPAATILTTTPVLWDQSGGTSDHMWVGDGINALMADDFIVGTGSTWRISEVMLSGMVLKIPIAFEIARSAGANPSGDVIHNYALPPFASVPSLCAPTCGLRDYLFKLPTPLVLEPVTIGLWWLPRATRFYGMTGLPLAVQNAPSGDWTRLLAARGLVSLRTICPSPCMVPTALRWSTPQSSRRRFSNSTFTRNRQQSECKTSGGFNIARKW